jgi:hypothetical protein
MKPKQISQGLPKVSEQMKAWSAALGREVSDWPRLSVRSFFGFTALYRKDKIFAALPRTRAWGTANSLAFKLEMATPAEKSRIEKDPRIGFTLMKKTRWYTFELSSDTDLHDALDWLGRAYEAAGKRRKSASQ